MRPTPPIEEEMDTIYDMRVGESKWIVPWGMYVNKDRSTWLHGGYLTHYRLCGTVRMLITRLNHGFYVDASRCRDRSWSRDASSYCGGVKHPCAVMKIKW
jgi:hypothetical protein